MNADAILDAINKKLGVDISDLVTDAAWSIGEGMLIEKHPEIMKYPGAHRVKIAEGILHTMRLHGWPCSPANMEAAYQIMQGTGIMDKIAEQQAELNNAPIFKPVEDEDAFMRSAPLDQVRTYLQAKYPGGK